MCNRKCPIMLYYLLKKLRPAQHQHNENVTGLGHSQLAASRAAGDKEGVDLLQGRAGKQV